MMEALPQVAALVAGLLGSAHCVLMCGGIASALGLGTQASGACSGGSLRFPALYNLGRIVSYTVAGGIAGALGGGTLALAGLPELGRAFAVLAALIIVIVGLRLAAGGRHFGWLDRAGAAAWRHIAPLTRGLFPVTTPARAFGVGLAWGWLPCGMSYAMLTAALFTGGTLEGSALMAMFGIGTLPAMLTLSTGAATLMRPATRRLGGAVLVLMGLASGAAMLWPAESGHEQHRHHGSLQGAAPFFGDLAGELPQLRGIEDPDRLALHCDHAQLRKA
jgi:sulfite exporter TauE/SafE